MIKQRTQWPLRPACYILFFLIVVIFSAPAQIGALGKPAITNYSPQDYGASPQNWAVAQDRRGVMYFGNGEGLLEYDGVNWRQVILPKGSTIRSLATDSEGRVYVGGVRELGYLSSGPGGRLQFVSLLDKIPEQYRDIADVWQIQAGSKGVYFTTTASIFLWDGQQMKVIPADEAFHLSAVVNDQFYVRQWGVGLMKLEGDRLRLVPGGEQFSEERIYVILPYDENRLLIGTRTMGLFLYDGASFTPFHTEADDLLREKLLYLPGAVLPGDRFALGTAAGGLLIIDRQGRLLQHLDSRTGLQNDFVIFTYLDREGALWLTLGKGISRLDIASPITYFDRNDGVNGSVYGIIQFEGQIYAALDAGVIKLDPVTGAFRPVKGVSGQTFGLVTMDGELFVPNLEKGLQRIQGDQAFVIRESVNYDFRINSLHAYRKQPGILFCGLEDGLSVLEKQGNGQWKEWGRIKEINEVVQYMVERDNGDLWFAGNSQILRVQLPQENNRIQPNQAVITSYGPDQGLPESVDGMPFAAHGREYVYLVGHGIFRYLPEEDRFVPDTAFQDIPAKSTPDFSIPATDRQNRLWLSFGAGVAKGAFQSNGAYQFTRAPFLPFANQTVFSIYPSDDGRVWFGGADLIIQYDEKVQTAAAIDFSTLIRRVENGEDSLLYNGTGPLPNNTLNYTDNTLSFSYAALSFQQEDKTQYQTWLENFDPGWSHWGQQTDRAYTNLPEGSYTFHVRARNVYQTISEEATYSFTILPPWYRTWWAYLLYLLAAAGLIYGIVRWRTGQLKARSEALERTVTERTIELQRSNEQIRQHAEELATVNEVSRALAEQLQLEDLIQLVGDQLRDLFRANIVYVGLLDQSSDMINFPYQHGDVIKPLRFGEGLTSQIIQTGKPMLINQDIDASYDQLGIQRIGKEAASYLGVPIPSGREYIGVLSVQSTELENRFTENDQKLLSTIAAHVGLAIHNAQLYEEAQAAKALAEEANEAKSSFLSTVSHELRTPLTSVLGFAKIVKKRLEDRILPVVQTDDPKVQKAVEQVAKNLDVISSEGERLTQLINDVLDLAKIEAGKIEWYMAPLQIGEVIERALDATQSLFEQKKLKLEKEISPDLPLVEADRNKLIQVVINLLSNAIKFTKEGTITCKAYRTQDQLIVSVTDTGVGIAPADQHKVFEKFKQVGDTLTDKPQGTGLGLPICKEIIQHHGGQLWLESEVGKGSTFFFSIPLQEKGAPGMHTAEIDALMKQLKAQIDIAPIAAHSNVNTILVVDDDASIRSLLVQELSEVGYQVCEAADGRAAIESVRQRKPDLILLDVMMPEMNGFDVAAVLKNDPNTMDIPIIILSIVQDHERGMRIGIDRYLTKPFDTEQLFQEVGSLLQQGQSRKKVLVVDENASTIKTLADVLQARGYQVVEANGQDLVEKALANQPDIIILNALMSEQNEAIKSLRFEKGMEDVLFLVYQ